MASASSATEAGADIIDYQPRAGVDPAIWFTMVAGYADSQPENTGVEGRQHHHGTDWMYGGWDRDVLQGDVAANGPNDGDKLLDWDGAYNLYTHCNAAYGGWNDVRKVDPNNILGLERAGLRHRCDGRLHRTSGAGRRRRRPGPRRTGGGDRLHRRT